MSNPRLSPAPLAALLLCIALAAAGMPAVQAGPQALSLEQTIGYLIEQVAASDRTFIRNASSYDGPQAAAHMTNKYRHFRDRIAGVDDFIELAASRSLLSGKPYLVVRADGSTQPTAQWLRELLARHCSQPGIDCAD